VREQGALFEGVSRKIRVVVMSPLWDIRVLQDVMMTIVARWGL
jgi:hypothetical protein